MARQFMMGWEMQHQVEGGAAAFSGSGASYDTAVFRTGAASLKVVAVSGSAGAMTVGPLVNPVFRRVYIKVSALPATTARLFIGSTGANLVGLKINPAGTITYRTNSADVGTSAVALTDTSRWYCVEFRGGTVTSGDLLLIDGVSQVTGTISGQTIPTAVGTADTVADTFTINYDDLVDDDAAFPGLGAVVLLVPTADSAGGTGWRLGTNTALGGNGFGSVDNRPPLGVADLAVGSDPKQIRNATANANDSFDATMTTYAAAGIGASDTVNGLFPFTFTAAPVTTSAKQGTVGISSNPVVANVALSAGGTSGAFWSGTTAGTFPTGWKLSLGTVTSAPSVTIGSAPVMRITQVTSSTRIAMVCFMGIYVDYTPAAVATAAPPFRSKSIHNALVR